MMPKEYRLDLEPPKFEITINDAKLRHTVITTAVKKHWRLIAIYGVVTIIGVAASYCTSKWSSVGISIVVDLITFLVGLGMLERVITITNEVR